jgi:hypothetical protein
LHSLNICAGPIGGADASDIQFVVNSRRSSRFELAEDSPRDSSSGGHSQEIASVQITDAHGLVSLEVWKADAAWLGRHVADCYLL